MSKSLVAVHGSYFANNFGDTLLVKLMCDHVASIVGKENVFLAISGHKVEQGLIGYPILPKQMRPNVSHLVFAGGGYLGEPRSGVLSNLRWSARAYLRHLIWLRSFPNAVYAYFGLGFGPLSNSFLRKKVQETLTQASKLLVRDKESFGWLTAYNVPTNKASVCVDFALSIKPTNPTQRQGIALHVDNLSIQEISLILRSLSVNYQAFTEEPLFVIFDNPPSAKSENKKKYVAALKEIGIEKSIEFLAYSTPSDLLNLLETFRLTITSKLHVGITTIALGGKVIAVPAHQKTIRLYTQLELGDFCVERAKLTDNNFSEALNKLEGFSPRKDVIAAGVEQIQAAVKNFLSESGK